MASKFWVSGGNGNWSSTTNWSTSSGGTSGAAVPTQLDDVFVNGNSGTSPVITVDATSNCLSLDFTGAITPTLAGVWGLNIYGSLTLIAAMTSTFIGQLNFQATATGKTITTNGISLTAALLFQGVGGGWTLQDNLTTSANISIFNGTFVSNNKTIACTDFIISGSSLRTVTLGTSTINCSGNFTATVVTNLTFTANTAIINMSGNTKIFTGGGLTYSSVNILGTPITITGSSTFTTITVATGKTLKLTSGTTQTVTSLVCNGNLANPSTLQSVTGGSAATIALPSGRYFIRHTSVKDITITGATAVTDIAGTNVSGNTGITFVTKFEMGRIKNDGSFNWYSSATGTVVKVSG